MRNGMRSSGCQRNQLNVEHEDGIRRDEASADVTGAIGKLRRYQQNSLAANIHAEQAFVPALDDLRLHIIQFLIFQFAANLRGSNLSLADVERKWLSTVVA